MKLSRTGLAAAIAIAITLGVAAPAGAVELPPPPAPVNFLPSTVKGAVSGLVGAGRAEVMAAYLYKFATTPGFWSAVSAVQSGGATAGQTSVVNTMKSSFSVPATKLAGLVRGAGAAGIAVSGYQFGATIGAEVVRAVGIDSQGLVCGTSTPGLGQGVAGFLTGVDCSSWEALQESYEANTGVPTGVQFGTICASGGSVGCYTLTVVGASQYSQGGIKFRSQYCVVQSGSNLTYSAGVAFKTLTGTVIASGQLTAQGNPPCNGLYGNNSANTGWVGLTTQQAAQDAALQIHSYCFTTTTGGATCQAQPAASAVGTQLQADPLRRIKCVLLATSGATTVGWTENYRESEGAIPAPNCTPLGGGLTMQKMTVFEEVNGTLTQLWEQDVTPEYAAGHELAPECDSGTCMLDLKKEGLSCFQDPTACVEWFKDPNKTSKYSCSYGTHVVDLAECNIYAPTFNPVDQATGQTYADYEGKPVPNPQHGTSTTPNNRPCWGSAWGDWNPLTWVLLPIKCSWEWAMIPTPGRIDQFTSSVQNTFNASPPGKLITVINGQVWPVIDAGGCGGFTIPMGWFEGLLAPYASVAIPDFHLLQACEGDMLRPFAIFSNLILSVGIIWIGFRTWPALLGKVFNYTGVDG